MRLTWVLWNGNVGGAETLAVSLVRALRAKSYDARVLFVQHSDPIGERLSKTDIPYDALGLARGRHVIFHPRALAAALGDTSDCAILVSPGYLAASARIGGFRGAIIAVEHGTILQWRSETRLRGIVRRLDRSSGLWACDAEIAVSSFALRELRRVPHARRLVCIPNGVDTALYKPVAHRESHELLVVGCASRLANGKGVDDLLRAFARLPADRIVLRIAGTGPELPHLMELARTLEIMDRVDFLGELGDVSSFWDKCDVAVVPSNQWIESFGMTAVEAMASGLPVVGTRNGGLCSVIEHDVTGSLVYPGDVDGLAEALRRYIKSPDLRELHGHAGRLRALNLFEINRCALEYAQFGERVIRERNG
jgi:glycosyltransferase involved in cell wall biosynthesis